MRTAVLFRGLNDNPGHLRSQEILPDGADISRLPEYSPS